MYDPYPGYVAPPPALRSHSRTLCTAWFVVGFLIALLPIPVAAFGLLPAYWIHARFLGFYTPVVCLLTFGYLLYVRDSLARLLFADVLNPSQERDRYRFYRESLGERLGRTGRRLRSTLLTLLPALLLGTSFGCFTLYTKLLMESVALATPIAVVSPPDTTATLASRNSAQATASAQPGSYSQSSRDTASVASQTAALDSAAVAPTSPSPQEVLRTTAIDGIPMFTTLTTLYIGIFASALAAVILMALREYAIDALGLSEEALVLGVRSEDEDAGAMS